MNTKVDIKFGTSEMCRIAATVCINASCEILFLKHTEHSSTTSPVNETQDYDN
jgi:RecA-family ATPase